MDVMILQSVVRKEIITHDTEHQFHSQARLEDGYTNSHLLISESLRNLYRTNFSNCQQCFVSRYTNAGDSE